MLIHSYIAVLLEKIDWNYRLVSQKSFNYYLHNRNGRLDTFDLV